MNYKNNKLIKLLLLMSLVLSLIVPNIYAKEASSATAGLNGKAPVSLKDDFYTAVNKEWLDSASIPSTEASTGTIEEMRSRVDKHLKELLDTLLETSYKKGTKEQKIAAFYKSALDMKNRNAQGLEPILKYIRAYDAAKTLDELILADLSTIKEVGQSMLFHGEVYTDINDSSKNTLYFSSTNPYFGKDVYSSKEGKAAYLKYVTSYFSLLGDTPEKARLNATALFEFEKQLADKALDPFQNPSLTETYIPYNFKSFDALYKHIDMPHIFKALGYQLPDKLYLMDEGLTKASAQALTDSNLDLLKNYTKINLLHQFAFTLSQACRDVVAAFNKDYYGIAEALDPKDVAVHFTSEYFSDELGQLYIDGYFSAESKKDVEHMVHELISVYEEKISNADWMSQGTKEKAIKKLDALQMKIGYPDVWPSRLDAVQTKTYEEGGSYFKNVCSVNLALFRNNQALQHKPADHDSWDFPVYTVNAFYSPLSNMIMFPAGFLQEPTYSTDASLAHNLGALGFVIGHEISHAFDTNGAQFDETGTASNWWTEEDYKNFEALWAKIEAFYDGVEIAPGVFSNGTLTLSENIADLAGLDCALTVLSKQENPDYETFFKAYASYFKELLTPEYLNYVNSSDVHSLGIVRVNRTVVNFEAFYKAFGITPKDKMYVPPKDRVSLG